MKTLKIACLFACIILLVSCLDNNTGPEVITEYTGKSNYYISNQSELDLSLTYEMKSRDRDSTIAVPASTTTKIFEDAAVGGIPQPSSALANLRFYKKSGDMTAPLLTIEPVVDEKWSMTTEENDAGNNEAIFELVITEQDIN